MEQTDPQKTTQKRSINTNPTKKPHVNSDAMEGLAVPASVGDIHRITFKRYKHHLFQTVMLTKFYIMYQ